MNTASSIAPTLLCLADTKLVLANICIKTVFNGRSIGDFATLLAVAGTSLGTTRSIYRWLEGQGESYIRLERGRQADEIASSDLLDAPPTSWVDLMATIFIAEAATSAIAKSLKDRADAYLSNQLRMLDHDSAFHMTYALGWLKVSTEQDRAGLRASMRVRIPLAMRWVRSCEERAVDAFAASCQPLTDLSGDPFPEAAPKGVDWNSTLMRAKSLPDRLFEIVRFKDAELLA